MYICVFFGDPKEDYDEMDIIEEYDMYENIYDFFEFLILKRGVKLFYSTANSDFDYLCEMAVSSLKEKYEDIELVKIAEKGDHKHREDFSYDRIINFENKNYKKRCIYAAHLSDYIFFDKFRSDDGLIDNFVMSIVLSKCFNEEKTRIYSLKKIMKKE